MRCFLSAPFERAVMRFDNPDALPSDVIGLDISFRVLVPMKPGDVIEIALPGERRWSHVYGFIYLDGDRHVWYILGVAVSFACFRMT